MEKNNRLIKSIETVSVFLLLNLSLQAQNIYSNGAKWYYTQISAIGPDTTFSTLEVISDTIINTTPCKKLSKLSGCDFLSTNVFIYSDSGKVYFFNNYFQSFKLLYDFETDSGNTWIVYPESPTFDSLIIHVDSTSTEIINNDTLNVLYTSSISTPGCFAFGGKIIEKIGSINYFFPQYCICDPPSGPLRCYSDSLLGLYETGIADSCDQITTGISLLFSSNEYSVYPNPAINFLKIKARSFASSKSVLIISDLFGRIIHSEYLDQSDKEVNLSSLTGGIYLATIKSLKQTITFKFLKI